MILSLLLTLLLFSGIGTVLAETESGGDITSIEGAGADCFTSQAGSAEIEKNDTNTGISVKSSSENLLLGYKKTTKFSDLKFSLALNSAENANLKIYINISDAENIKAQNYLRIAFDTFADEKFTANLEYVSSAGEVSETMEYTKCSFLKNSLDQKDDTQTSLETGRNGIQAAIGTSQKYANNIPGVMDGSLVDFLFFRSNKSMILDEDYEILAESCANMLEKVKTLQSAPAYLSLEIVNPDKTETAITLYQFGESLFYDYDQVPSAYAATEESVAYSKISINWDVKDYANYDYEGYVLERFKGDDSNLEKSVTYKTKATSYYSDSKLTQNTDYIYRITAYRGLSDPVAVKVFQYADFKVRTKDGSIVPYILGFVGFVIVFSAFTFVYVNWNDIKEKIKKRKEANKKDGSVQNPE